jgi:hypothetical protein
MAFGTGAQASSSQFKLLDLSLPHFSLASGERIVGFSCAVRGGRILRINPPDLWDLSLENGTAGTAQLQAFIIDGAAAFEPGDLDYFDRFLTVGRAQEAAAPFERYFDVRVMLLISRSGDDKNLRKLTFSKDQLTLFPRGSLN